MVYDDEDSKEEYDEFRACRRHRARLAARFDAIHIKDRLSSIEYDIEGINEQNEDTPAQILKLEESLSNSNKNQQNINIILLITSGVCIYLSTTR